MSYTDTVELRYSLTEKEYVSAVRYYFLSSMQMLPRIIILYVLIAAGFLLLNVLLGSVLPLWSIIALISLVGVALVHAYLVELPRRYFRSDPKFRSEYNLTFRDAGIKFKTQDIDSSIAWSLYTGVIENEKFYFMIYGKNLPSLTILPKRAFRDSNEENAFRQMLRRHVDQTLKLGDGEREYVPISSQPPDWR
jgi:hypothetical protein